MSKVGWVDLNPIFQTKNTPVSVFFGFQLMLGLISRFMLEL